MEITNRNKNCRDNSCGRNIYLGVFLIATGALWLMRNLGLISGEVFNILISWESLLIVIGGFLMAMRNWISGAVIALTGVCFMILNILNVPVSFGKVILPAILIAIGISILASRFPYRR